MIKAVLQCDCDGGFNFLSVNGHAFFAKRGRDIVCAAVSVLARTCSSFLQSKQIDFESCAPKRGSLSVQVCSVKEEEKEILRNLADILKVGFSDIQEDFPKLFSFEVQSK